MAQAEIHEAKGVASFGAASPVRGSVWLGAILAVSALAYLSYLAFVGALDGLQTNVGGRVELRHGAVISTLIGFVLTSRLYVFRHLRADVAALLPLLPGPVPPDPETAPEFAPAGMRAAAVLGGLVGLGVAAASYGSWERLRDTFDAHAVWSFAANLVLFALMLQLAWTQRAGEHYLDRTVTARLSVPLLEGERLSAYARRGLRSSLFWFLGSSIASLLFINWGFSWTVALVMLCTVGLGVFALLEPSRRLRRRIRAAKHAELAQVRAAIQEARDAALRGEAAPHSDSEAAAGRLPGLLAWEARVEAVREWPFDTSTWLRFGALAAIAVGSWLGGALVERVLGLALDP